MRCAIMRNMQPDIFVAIFTLKSFHSEGLRILLTGLMANKFCRETGLLVYSANNLLKDRDDSGDDK